MERKDCKQQFAMKTIKITGIDRYQKLSILTEIRILLTSDHEYLLKCYDLFMHRRRLCIITEYIDGGDLDQYIKKNKPLNSEEIMKIFLKICVGVNALHTNQVIHRDIKPANILITTNGDIKICDFGICKYLDYNKVTNTMVGTPYFMSPEQMYQRHYDYKSDVWGIGCVLFMMMYGEYPFKGKGMRDLKRNIQTSDPLAGLSPGSKTLDGILREMIDKNKTKRPDLISLLQDDSNQKLLHHYGIPNQHSKFRKYRIPSIPHSEEDWGKVLSRIRTEFFLPASLYNRTAEILRESRMVSLPSDSEVPKLTSYAAIKKARVRSPDVIPKLKIPPRRNGPIVQGAQIRTPWHGNPPPESGGANARRSVTRSSMARREPPRQISHPATPGIARVPTPLYPVKENNRIRQSPYSAAIKKAKQQYLPRPCGTPTPLPRVRNRYKNIQSKVKQCWAPRPT